MIDFIKANPVMFAIGGAILLVAFAGVIVAISLKGRWEDRGFLKTEDGKDYFWKDASTRTLHMYIEDAVPKHLIAALLGWVYHIETHYAKRELFTIHHPAPAPASTRIDVLVMMDGENPYVQHQIDLRTGEVLTVLVGFPHGLLPAQSLYVVQHEGGHILCLAHDESTASAMHPRFQKRRVSYTDNDGALLEETYSSKGADDDKA